MVHDGILPVAGSRKNVATQKEQIVLVDTLSAMSKLTATDGCPFVCTRAIGELLSDLSAPMSQKIIALRALSKICVDQPKDAFTHGFVLAPLISSLIEGDTHLLMQGGFVQRSFGGAGGRGRGSAANAASSGAKSHPPTAEEMIRLRRAAVACFPVLRQEGNLPAIQRVGMCVASLTLHADREITAVSAESMGGYAAVLPDAEGLMPLLHKLATMIANPKRALIEAMRGNGGEGGGSGGGGGGGARGHATAAAMSARASMAGLSDEMANAQSLLRTLINTAELLRGFRGKLASPAAGGAFKEHTAGDGRDGGIDGGRDGGDGDGDGDGDSGEGGEETKEVHSANAADGGIDATEAAPQGNPFGGAAGGGAGRAGGAASSNKAGNPFAPAFQMTQLEQIKGNTTLVRKWVGARIALEGACLVCLARPEAWVRIEGRRLLELLACDEFRDLENHVGVLGPHVRSGCDFVHDHAKAMAKRHAQEQREREAAVGASAGSGVDEEAVEGNPGLAPCEVEWMRRLYCAPFPGPPAARRPFSSSSSLPFSPSSSSSTKATNGVWEDLLLIEVVKHHDKFKYAANWIALQLAGTHQELAGDGSDPDSLRVWRNRVALQCALLVGNGSAGDSGDAVCGVSVDTVGDCVADLDGVVLTRPPLHGFIEVMVSTMFQLPPLPAAAAVAGAAVEALALTHTSCIDQVLELAQMVGVREQIQSSRGRGGGSIIDDYLLDGVGGGGIALALPGSTEKKMSDPRMVAPSEGDVSFDPTTTGVSDAALQVPLVQLAVRLYRAGAHGMEAGVEEMEGAKAGAEAGDAGIEANIGAGRGAGGGAVLRHYAGLRSLVQRIVSEWLRNDLASGMNLNTRSWQTKNAGDRGGGGEGAGPSSSSNADNGILGYAGELVLIFLEYVLSLPGETERDAAIEPLMGDPAGSKWALLRLLSVWAGEHGAPHIAAKFTAPPTTVIKAIIGLLRLGPLWEEGGNEGGGGGGGRGTGSVVRPEDMERLAVELLVRLGGWPERRYIAALAQAMFLQLHPKYVGVWVFQSVPSAPLAVQRFYDWTGSGGSIPSALQTPLALPDDARRDRDGDAMRWTVDDAGVRFVALGMAMDNDLTSVVARTCGRPALVAGPLTTPLLFVAALAGVGCDEDEEVEGETDGQRRQRQLLTCLRGGSKFDDFAAFLHTELADENLNFWKAVETFKMSASSWLGGNSRGSVDCDAEFKIGAEAVAIFDAFICNNAHSMININGAERARVAKQVEDGVFALDMFDQAQDTIFNAVSKDNWPRFLEKCRKAAEGAPDDALEQLSIWADATCAALFYLCGPERALRGAASAMCRQLLRGSEESVRYVGAGGSGIDVPTRRESLGYDRHDRRASLAGSSSSHMSSTLPGGRRFPSGMPAPPVDCAGLAPGFIHSTRTAVEAISFAQSLSDWVVRATTVRCVGEGALLPSVLKSAAKLVSRLLQRCDQGDGYATEALDALCGKALCRPLGEAVGYMLRRAWAIAGTDGEAAIGAADGGSTGVGAGGGASKLMVQLVESAEEALEAWIHLVRTADGDGPSSKGGHQEGHHPNLHRTHIPALWASVVDGLAGKAWRAYDDSAEAVLLDDSAERHAALAQLLVVLQHKAETAEAHEAGREVARFARYYAHVVQASRGAGIVNDLLDQTRCVTAGAVAPTLFVEAARLVGKNILHLRSACAGDGGGGGGSRGYTRAKNAGKVGQAPGIGAVRDGTAHVPMILASVLVSHLADVGAECLVAPSVPLVRTGNESMAAMPSDDASGGGSRAHLSGVFAVLTASQAVRSSVRTATHAASEATEVVASWLPWLLLAALTSESASMVGEGSRRGCRGGSVGGSTGTELLQSLVAGLVLRRSRGEGRESGGEGGNGGVSLVNGLAFGGGGGGGGGAGGGGSGLLCDLITTVLDLLGPWYGNAMPMDHTGQRGDQWLIGIDLAAATLMAACRPASNRDSSPLSVDGGSGGRGAPPLGEIQRNLDMFVAVARAVFSMRGSPPPAIWAAKVASRWASGIGSMPFDSVRRGSVEGTDGPQHICSLVNQLCVVMAHVTQLSGSQPATPDGAGGNSGNDGDSKHADAAARSVRQVSPKPDKPAKPAMISVLEAVGVAVSGLGTAEPLFVIDSLRLAAATVGAVLCKWGGCDGGGGGGGGGGTGLSLVRTAAIDSLSSVLDTSISLEGSEHSVGDCISGAVVTLAGRGASSLDGWWSTAIDTVAVHSPAGGAASMEKVRTHMALPVGMRPGLVICREVC
jgi:hypothetical protein